jgi:hypothetical protein
MTDGSSTMPLVVVVVTVAPAVAFAVAEIMLETLRTVFRKFFVDWEFAFFLQLVSQSPFMQPSLCPFRNCFRISVCSLNFPLRFHQTSRDPSHFPASHHRQHCIPASYRHPHGHDARVLFFKKRWHCLCGTQT